MATGKLRFAQKFAPLDCGGGCERNFTADTELSTRDAEGFQGGQIIAASPEHDTYFHETLSPFFVRASNVASARRTDSAELAGVHNDGCSPLWQHFAKYSISAA